ncbi:hypothetical protein E0Z10_g8831 [Xylaria hypoxylon]|uniref:Methyltransferase domain-containing protein n=1 Tax=Xylaria hypoxylon TaxID=37992 RepID=A0A4Z0YQS6_9PEZI|nr:hypothetical protein E0Z10_g8831 [Xylaria hypoxylon]
MKGSNRHLTLLDVGAGSGSMSVGFAQLIGPEGHVTAVDVNPDVIQRAKAIAEVQGVTNILFQTSDAYKLPFRGGSFDIVHCHQVLIHTENQWEILQEMLRVAKPGGVVAARESDFETQVIWPPLPGLLKYHDFSLKLVTASGGCESAGRQLLSWALRAGVTRGQITTIFSAWTYTEPEDRKVWGERPIFSICLSWIVAEYVCLCLAAGMIDMLRGSNNDAGITEADMDEMRDAWVEWVDRDNAVLAMLHGEIIIRK